jgi:hypothetical protein
MAEMSIQQLRLCHSGWENARRKIGPSFLPCLNKPACCHPTGKQAVSAELLCSLLLDDRCSGYGALAILVTVGSGNADGADDLAVRKNRHSAFDGHSAFQS